MDDVPDVSRDGTLAEQADEDLARRCTAGIWGYVTLTLVLLFATDYRFKHPAVAWTTAAITWLACLARLLVLLWKKTGYPAHPDRWRKLLGATVLTASGTWGLLAGLTVHLYAHGTWTATVLVFCTVGACSTSLTNLTPNGPLLLATQTSLIFPTIVAGLYVGGDHALTMSALSTIFLGFLLFNGHRLSQRSRDTLRARDAIHREIAATKEAEREVKHSLGLLRSLAGRLNSAREEERTKVAREIHDELGQALTAIKIEFTALLRYPPDDNGLSAVRSESILKLLDQTIASVRRIARELRPTVLDDLGLVAALEWATEEFQIRTGTKCRVSLPDVDIALDVERASALFRIFQETLTNVARHADATQVDVRLGNENGYLVLEVCDNGIGVSEAQLSAGTSLGFLGMRERILLLGGTLTITGTPGNGTTVRVLVPDSNHVGEKT